MSNEPSAQIEQEAGKKPTRRRPLRLFAFFAWLGLLGATVQLGLANFWHDDLQPISREMLWVHYASFQAGVFLFHAGLATAICAVFALLTRRRAMLIVAAVLSGGLLTPEHAHMRFESSGKSVGSSPSTAGLPAVVVSKPMRRDSDVLRVISMNLQYSRVSKQAILETIALYNPDVICFQEWTKHGSSRVKEILSAEYSYIVEEPHEDAFGQAIFSKRPFVEESRAMPRFYSAYTPQIQAAVELDGRPIRLMNIHLATPGTLSYFAEQRKMTVAITNWLKRSESSMQPQEKDPRPEVLLGDFNATPRTAILEAFEKVGYHSAFERAAGVWTGDSTLDSIVQVRGSTWPRGLGLLSLAPGEYVWIMCL